MGFFDKIKQGLKRTTDAVSEQFNDIMSNFVKIDADSLEQLEEALILSDIGATVAPRPPKRWKTSPSTSASTHRLRCAACSKMSCPI